MSGHPELYVGLLGAIVVLAGVARLVGLPYPIVLVLGGLGLSFVPGVPAVRLDPELVFFVFLPPLLFAAAYYGSSPRELRASARPIGFLAFGLVFLTTLIVAVVAHAIVDGLSWPAAVILGAVVSPTDPVAAAAVFRRLQVPRQVVTIVEGESLVNDASALTIYRVAVGVAVGGAFSLPDAALAFVVVDGGGVLLGLLTGAAVVALRRRVDDPTLVIAITLLTPYLAYVPAEELGASGILAAVTVGIYMGRHDPRLLTPPTRLQTHAFWEMLEFLLNASLFVLLGAQLPTILEDLAAYTAAELVLAAATVSALVIAVRVLFVFGLSGLVPLSGRGRGLDPRERLVVSWSGMRGAVSLAAALAVPLETSAGAPLAGRELIIFLTFAVIFATLVLQGLTLAPLVNRLSFTPQDDAASGQESASRRAAARAALQRLDEIATEREVPARTLDIVREHYEEATRRLDGASDGGVVQALIHDVALLKDLRLEALDAERETIGRLLVEGSLSHEVMRRIERDLDLEQAQVLDGDPSRA